MGVSGSINKCVKTAVALYKPQRSPRRLEHPSGCRAPRPPPDTRPPAPRAPGARALVPFAPSQSATQSRNVSPAKPRQRPPGPDSPACRSLRAETSTRAPVRPHRLAIAPADNTVIRVGVGDSPQCCRDSTMMQTLSSRCACWYRRPRNSSASARSTGGPPTSSSSTGVDSEPGTCTGSRRNCSYACEGVDSWAHTPARVCVQLGSYACEGVRATGLIRLRGSPNMCTAIPSSRPYIRRGFPQGEHTFRSAEALQ